MAEVVVGFKDQSVKTRKLAHEVLERVASNVASIKKFTFKLLAGLASSTPTMKSSSLLAIAFLIKLHNHEFSQAEVQEVTEIVLFIIKAG